MGILWPHSNTVARTNADRRAPGALAYFFEARTTTPRTTYQDANLTTPHAHPVVADGYGRFPAIFLDFGPYRERVKTAGMTQLWDTDDIPNPAPFDEEVGVDPDTLLKTGDVFFGFCDDIRDGAVRANGDSIGNAVSGATERANDDTFPLYERLYTKLDNTAVPVSGGRGANAAADFAAGKRLTLPDLRSRGPLGLETMGNSAAGRMSSIVPGYTASTNATLPGYAVGAHTHTLTTAEAPSHTHTGTTGSGGSHTHTATTSSDGIHSHTISITDPGHTHSQGNASQQTFNAASVTGSGGQLWASAATVTGSNTTGISASSNSTGAHTHVLTTSSDGPHTHSFTSDATGGGGSHNNVQQGVLGTWYIKL